MAAAKLAVVDPVVAQVIATLDVPHGGGAIGVAFAGDGRRAYLAMSAGDHVSVEVIDPATGAFTGAINVPYQGSQGALAISADGTRGYLALIERDLVAVLDLVAGRVVTTYAVTMPIGLELSADGSRLYAGTFGWMGESEYHIWLFDTRTGGLLAGGRYEHPAPYGRACSDIEGLALTPDGRTLYAASVDGDGVLVVDAATLAAAGMIPTHALAAFFPLRAVLSPDGAFLYVASGIREPTTVSVVDTHSLAVVGEISGDPRGPCPSRSYGLYLSPDGRTLYLLASDANCLLLADTASRTIAGSYRIGESGKPLMHVAAHSDGRRLYVLDRAGTVFILNPASGVVTKTLTTIPDAYTVKLAPDGRRAYVGGGPGFAVLDLTTDMVLQVVDFGQTGGFGWLNRRTIGAKPDGSQFVVGDFWNLHVYDAGSGVEVRSVDLRTWNPLRTASTDAIFSADSRAGYLAMWDEKAVLAFDAVTWQVTAKIDVGRAPYFGLCPGWLVLSPDGRRLYAVAEEGDNVIAIDTGAGTVIRAIRVGRPYQRYLPMTLRKVARR
jgi:DNA-binding beta-propeller fold protein YncE